MYYIYKYIMYNVLRALLLEELGNIRIYDVLVISE